MDKRKRWMVVVIFLYLAVLLLMIVVNHNRQTSAEKAAKAQMEMQQEAQRKAMEQDLGNVRKGDLLEENDGEILWVYFAEENGFVRISSSEGHRGTYAGAKGFAKRTKRIIHKTDPDYPQMAVKFINQ